MQVLIALLAAGRSSRMGFPKQLWEWEGRSLVRRMAETALQAKAEGVRTETVVITGSHAEEISAQVSDLPVTLLFNPDWEEGMGSSVRAATLAAGNSDALLILLTDQMAVTSALLTTLMTAWKQHPGRPVVCDYGEAWGPPLVIPLSYRPELLALHGDTGAKFFLRHSPENLVRVQFPEGKLDLDTPEDLLRLGKRGSGV